MFHPVSRLIKRGVSRIVSNVGVECGGRECAFDEWRMKRTAKSCGPDAPTLASSLVEAIREAMVAKKPGSPGRARRKPLKPFARGMPGESGVTVVDLLGVLFIFAPEATGAIRAPGIPCALYFGAKIIHDSGAIRTARTHAYANRRIDRWLRNSTLLYGMDHV
ncbi:MAG TPA: hypothetical protein VKT76_03530 [Bradyrhizobium sp.]|nr:hypothetical protein [Bradyrhizobium sp.]